MGYAMLHAHCIACGNLMGCNPHKVPSLVVNGKREPVCRSCVESANVEREKKGLPLFTIHPDAYEPIHESQL